MFLWWRRLTLVDLGHRNIVIGRKPIDLHEVSVPYRELKNAAELFLAQITPIRDLFNNNITYLLKDIGMTYFVKNQFAAVYTGTYLKKIACFSCERINNEEDRNTFKHLLFVISVDLVYLDTPIRGLREESNINEIKSKLEAVVKNANSLLVEVGKAIENWGY